MYAVIESGGKQYRVAPGDVIRVEKLDVQTGDSIHLDRVLLVAGDSGVQVGQPTLANTRVTATVKAHGRGEKHSRVQAPPAQAFPQDHRSPAGFHRDRDYRHRRLTVQTRSIHGT